MTVIEQSLIGSSRSGGIWLYAQSWVFSLLIHGTAVGSAFVVLGDLKLAPEPEPFTWEVSLVESSSPVAEGSAPAQPVSQPVQAVQPVQQEPQPAKTPPVKPKIVEPVKPVQPVVAEIPKKVEQQVTEVTPVEPVPQTVMPVTPPIEPEKPIEEKDPVEMKTAEAVVPAETLPPQTPPQTKVARAEPHKPVLESAPATATAQPQTAISSAAAEKPAPAAPPAPIQEATLRPMPAQPGAGRKADFGWLAQTLWDRVARLKRYPHTARANHLEGRVVIRAVITEDGRLAEANVSESSGHSVLDEDALEVIRRACPLKLKQPLGRRQVVVQVPINYRLEN
jgi:protein TonB